MKYKYLKLIFAFIIFITVIFIKTTVQANSIDSIEMSIYIDNNGNAEVTEVWSCYTNEGTESYHPYYNLGNSKITGLRVKSNNTTYTTLGEWDVDASFYEKAYKCGINEIYNGVEICWGISNYGNNVYTVSYNISNFVSQLADSQMMYWTLIPKDFSVSIESVKIRIYAKEPFSDTIPVWGYGNYGGLCYVDNGVIYMSTDGASLSTSEYMTILAKFPNETFNTRNVLDKDFNHYYEMAQEGSTAYNHRKQSILSKIISFIGSIIVFIPWVIIAIIGAVKGTEKKYGFKYGQAGKNIPKNVAYYRDIPCNGDIFRAYYIAYQYNLVKNKTDILGAIILKWLKQGIIRTEQKEQGKIFKKEDTIIILGDEKNRNFDNDREKKLFNMMYEASGDGILENKEFEKWCKKSYEKILDWFDDILKEQRNNLTSNKLITQEQGFWGKKYIATQELKDEALQLAGLRKFLLDYTLIKDRQAIEVELFEDYLIYSQMLGIAKQVSKQFKELYPEMIEQTNYGSYDNIVYINYVSSRGVSSASSARAAAESYSSGGGGFSSGGGGGGSFGGGGGRRRFSLMKDKITIGLFIDTYFPMVDGVIMVVHNYAKRLTKYANVIVFAPDCPGNKYDDSILPYNVVRCKALNFPLIDYGLPIPALDKKFKQELEKYNLDIVHIHSPVTVGKIGVKYAKKHNIPVVATMHSQFKQDLKRAVKLDILASMLNKIFIKVFNKCDECWAVNNEVARIFYEEYGYKTLPRVVNNSTDMEKVKDKEKACKKINKLHGINENEKVFLFVGRLNKLKNIFFIADALKILKQNNPMLKFKMLYVGSGQDEEELKTYIKKNNLENEVIFCGRVTDRDLLAAYYARADLFLFPSLYDASSIVQIEAASQNTPTVFLEGAATTETVAHNVNGFIVKNDVNEYAKQIERIINNKELYDNVSRNAYRDLYKNWDDTIEEVYNRYIEIIK